MVDIRVGQTTVPDPLKGLTQEAAEEALATADLLVAYATSQYSTLYDVGTVMALDQTEGADIDPGSTITLTLSLGEEPATAGLGGGLLQIAKRRRHRARRRKFRKVRYQ
jgi:serine/threonine-protein kinase